MSDTVASLRRKINSAGNLQGVVSTMKNLAASSIGQYERSVRSLRDYYRTVELGLSVSIRSSGSEAWMSAATKQKKTGTIGAVVFGSDQGLVGRFNDEVVEHALTTLAALTDEPQLWAVSERIHAQLTDDGTQPAGFFTVPNSIRTITPLIGEILLAVETNQSEGNELHLFYNRPLSRTVYEPAHQRLLPLDDVWLKKLADLPWPTTNLPEIVGAETTTLQALIREYLFVSLFRACTESLASENASRLAAMQRADKNIEELLADLNGTYHRLRQSSIDEELFDVIAGSEALSHT